MKTGYEVGIPFHFTKPKYQSGLNLLQELAMAKSYYFILEINSDASQDQIKSAYREQVKQLHPDYYGEDSKPFRELQEAYAILSEPKRRKAYDQQFQNRTAKSPIEIRKTYRNSGSSSPNSRLKQ